MAAQYPGMSELPDPIIQSAPPVADPPPTWRPLATAAGLFMWFALSAITALEPDWVAVSNPWWVRVLAGLTSVLSGYVIVTDLQAWRSERAQRTERGQALGGDGASP